MLPLDLFKRRNFAIGNVQTLTMYGGLGLLFFFLILFLQQVAGYSALEAGTATLPVSIVMFFLSARFGALADRFGPRWFMGGGPLVAAVGLALFARLDQDVSYLTDLLPAMLLFALGLSMTVAPAHRHRAGRRRRAQRRRGLGREQRDRPRGGPGGGGGGGRGDRRAVRLGARRAAGPAGRPPRAGGPAGGAPSVSRWPRSGRRACRPSVSDRVAEATDEASVSAFRFGMGIAAVLVAGGGLLGLIGLRNPRREVKCADCPGGALAGAPPGCRAGEAPAAGEASARA